MRKILLYLIMSATLLAGCKSTQKATTDENGKTGMNKTEKGAVIGAASGAVVAAGGVMGPGAVAVDVDLEVDALELDALLGSFEGDVTG